MAFHLRSLVRDYAALAGSEIMSKAAGFVAFAYLARTLGPDAYGTIEFTVAIHMVAFLVVDFGLAPIGARAITNDPTRAHGLGRQIPALRLLLSFVAYASMLLCTVAIGRSDALPLVALYGLSLLASPWKLNWLLQGLDLIRFVGPAQLVYMVAFALGVVVVVRSPEDMMRVGFVEIGAATLMAGYFITIGRRHVPDLRPKFDTAALRPLFREAAPVGVSQLMWAVNQFGPTLVVASLLASDAVAYFGAAHRILLSLGSFVFLYFFNIYPSLVRATENGAADFARGVGLSFRLTSWTSAVIGLVGTLLAVPICTLVYGDAFAPTGELLGLLIWVLPLSFASGHARFALLASGNQRMELVTQTLSAVVTLVGCVVLIPIHGIGGAAMAMLASASLGWLTAHFAFTRSVAPLPSVGPFLRPAGALALAFGFAQMSPLASPWTTTLCATGILLGVGLVLEWPFLRTLRDGPEATGGEPGAR